MMRTLTCIILALFVAFSIFVSTPITKTAVASEDIEWSWANPYPVDNELTSIINGSLFSSQNLMNAW